ncbi:hypothetical protein ACGFOU_27325 [Streptomyces sp. NPDC048595]|uniref:hypothetical protein n=1 Tax=Streptomyces sp. NPDC048595 TaxID=3365576 RepID=UPI003721A5B4
MRQGDRLSAHPGHIRGDFDGFARALIFVLERCAYEAMATSTSMVSSSRAATVFGPAGTPPGRTVGVGRLLVSSDL